MATAVVALSFGVTGYSSATLTASTTNPSTVTASTDWTPPTVTVRSPGEVVSGTVVVTADAADGPGESGVAGVTIQYLAPNTSAWVDLCTASAVPYSCPWDTTARTSGTYGLRAVASDSAGYSSTSAQVRTVVANGTRIVLDDPGAIVRGDVPLSATVYNAGSLNLSVRFEYAAPGGADGAPSRAAPGCLGRTPGAPSRRAASRPRSR